jgi:septal ring factor EnvC (AmiA/AmiB activator)
MRAMRTEVADIRRARRQHTGLLNALNRDVAGLRRVQEQQAGLLGRLGQDVAGLKQDVAVLRADMADVKVTLAEILRRLPPVARQAAPRPPSSRLPVGSSASSEAGGFQPAALEARGRADGSKRGGNNSGVSTAAGSTRRSGRPMPGRSR